ncbi:DUF6628 family protein [Stakelama marina]|nr:DUF6628 family protein [Stakelama marina]
MTTNSPQPLDALTTMLPHRQPDSRMARLALFAVRQMGANGLHDAHAQHALFLTFGQRYRRPLTALRTLVFELSQTSSRPIRIAPRCCCRMTADEEALVTILQRATDNAPAAEMLLADLTGCRTTPGLFMTVQFVADAFADAGRPL